ncbi:hypothetical protein SCLCIDRAFT_188506 [Scleroderma citrinum Foug A]|uniref:Uncharacterized protein n=1 Tax=Scleroderma citrinum Foug A TaxID=1036808 RepID=A0A0C2ZX70_9AGAM|nr:hypothetical protein SCLCIDRAFT_188506 [Scleroderma citrinum Foug A]
MISNVMLVNNHGACGWRVQVLNATSRYVYDRMPSFILCAIFVRRGMMREGRRRRQTPCPKRATVCESLQEPKSPLSGKTPEVVLDTFSSWY